MLMTPMLMTPMLMTPMLMTKDSATLAGPPVPASPIALDPDALAQQWAEWKTGVAYEVAFWSRWVADRGGRYGEDYDKRLRPDLPVDHHLEGVLASLGQAEIALLDVGAGPLCCLGRVSQHARLRIVAVDPLAAHYDRILAEHGLAPPVRTRFGLGEDLALQFDRGAFDIVHCQNALDHSIDPVRVVLQMLEVCRLGGTVMLRHAHDEAEHEQYSGFHKWNLTNDGEHFIVWNRSARRDLSEAFAAFAETRMLQTDGYLINVFRKTADVPAGFFVQDRLRMSHFQEAVIGALM